MTQEKVLMLGLRSGKRYDVKQVTICGKSGDVQGEAVASWKERLHEFLMVSKENI